MGELNAKLFRLLKDELDSLATGHSYNLVRIRQMKDICHILAYYACIEVDDVDIEKLKMFL